MAATTSFYLRRIYLIGPTYRWLAAPATLCLVISQGFGIAAGIYAVISTPSILEFYHISWLFSVAYGLVGVTDILLAGMLVYVLQQSRTGSRRADGVLDTLIIYTINTGLLTSLCSILAFVFALILPGNLIYAGLSIIGTKLYANSVLAMLNSRREINNRFLDDFTLPEIPQVTNTTIGTAGGQHRRGVASESIVWNVAQRSMCLSNRESMYQTDEAPSGDSNDLESIRDLDSEVLSKAGLRNGEDTL
ncbi:hypothetical protein BC628DRAFT_1378941 [Trametes gibbosa]|nr:hypothetical protein BC628DRAFT_1378941 [Trametes gibbosa]